MFLNFNGKTYVVFRDEDEAAKYVHLYPDAIWVCFNGYLNAFELT